MHLEELKQLILQVLEDSKAQNLVVLDVTSVSSVTDYMIIASGTSSRQVTAMAQNLHYQLKERNQEPLGIEGMEDGEWVLVDLGDILVHLMQPATREFYSLEKLWGEFTNTGNQPQDPNPAAHHRI